MKQPLIYIFTLFLLACSSSSAVKEENKYQEKDITGIWTHKYSSWNTGPEYAANELPFPEPPFDTFWITDSTISFFNYPQEYLYTVKYKRNGNTITILNSKDKELNTYQIQLVDTLIHFTHKITYRNNEKDWLELIEKHTRDSLDISTLELLIKDTINYKLLEGNWELNTFYSAEDGSEPIELVFPLKFPHKLKFPIAQLDTAANKQVVQLNIEGKNRWFKIRMRSQNGFELMPYGWSLEDCPSIYYYTADE